MAIEGWYYLHTDGNLIYKRELGETAADIRESPFAVALWPCDTSDRGNAWRILVEGLAAGADRNRVTELARKWGCDDTDAQIYADHVGARLYRDGSQWCATRVDFVNLQESPAGFGETCLGALSELCKSLGYRPSKMWGIDFAALLIVSPDRKGVQRLERT